MENESSGKTLKQNITVLTIFSADVVITFTNCGNLFPKSVLGKKCFSCSSSILWCEPWWGFVTVKRGEVSVDTCPSELALR